jgi:hypothetical protein
MTHPVPKTKENRYFNQYMEDNRKYRYGAYKWHPKIKFSTKSIPQICQENTPREVCSTKTCTADQSIPEKKKIEIHARTISNQVH